MTTNAERRPQTAIFIDGENHADLSVATLMQQLEEYEVVERHAYADWRARRLDPLSLRLFQHDFEMHHVFSGQWPGAQKDITDGHMARAMKRVLVESPGVSTVVIVSGDAFFVSIVILLRRKGQQVIVAADPFRVCKELAMVADEYLPVGKWGQLVPKLDRLEYESKYLTFSFVVKKLKIRSCILAEMIRRGLVVQKPVNRPERGIRPELRLNRQNPVVKVILRATIRSSFAHAVAA